NDQRHAPKSLPRNTKNRPLCDHAVKAVMPPGRRPFHFVDFLQRALAQIIALHADEPLLGSPKNHRILAAPTMRIAVPEFRAVHQSASFRQQLNNRLVPFEYLPALLFRPAFDESPLVLERRVSI